MSTPTCQKPNQIIKMAIRPRRGTTPARTHEEEEELWTGWGRDADLVPVGLGVVLAEVLVERLERLRLLLLEQPEEAPELRLPPRQAPGPAAPVGLPQLPHRLAQLPAGLRASTRHCARAHQLRCSTSSGMLSSSGSQSLSYSYR
jgi:hypothetical protein